MAENDNDLGFCANNWETRTYSNAKLKPEKSRQFSIGVLSDPTPELSVGLDYWYIEKRNLISTLGVDVILSDLAKYGSLVHRDEDGVIDHIDLVKENRGKQRIAGADRIDDLVDEALEHEVAVGGMMVGIEIGQNAPLAQLEDQHLAASLLIEI